MMHKDSSMIAVSGIDLSKILGENQIWMKNVVKTDKCMGVSQLLGDACQGCHQSLRLWSLFTISIYL